MNADADEVDVITDDRFLRQVLLARAAASKDPKTEKKEMENKDLQRKDIRVEIPHESEMLLGGGQVVSGLTRQPSITKGNCLCSPTSHAGSFRCRLHRASSLQRTRIIDSATQVDAPPAKAPTPTNENIVHAQ
ncbi:hypothetical protein Nepgr_032955 [Nepenthes gracilis]|uniref:Uncharacterized protein n=1 Tax=Nepenthes gracilis TaxID=150966 RepID=A0AAD3TLU9_NEPGR|nr:hypothetical protein Nepgr_032955 [Nepenthes gracilis]